MLQPLRRIRLPGFSGHSPAALNFMAVRSGLLICALFLLTGLATAGDYGQGADELFQRQIAQANLDYIRGQGDSFAPLPYPFAFYGPAFELPLLLAERALGLTDGYHIHRLRLTLTHLFFIIGGYFCYRLAYRLFDNRLLALFALLLFLVHPRIYGHSFVNSKDLPFLALFAITLYLLERAFRRDSLGAFLLLGIAVGLLANLRVAGIILLPAALAMRGLDLGRADGWAERKQILATGGLLILAAGLTFYAATPYAWANPVAYLTTSLELTVNHPNVVFQRFQGQLLSAAAMPPHYGITWFGITTPPLILMLGFIGIAAVAAQGIARPGAVFRNTRRRFLLLLLAGFALPLLAAALLEANQYDGWRQLYLVYVPFCLLAALGGGRLAAALARRPGGRAGLCGLAAVGLGLIVLQMAQIHPLQPVYFNFLGDRATPEQLRTQYEMDYWSLAQPEGLAYLLERHPGETLVVRAGARHINILPTAARRHLTVATGDNRADYAMTKDPKPYQPDWAFNSPYRRRLYNNTLIALRPLDAARMTDAAIAAYREIYREAIAGEPVIRADYDVYVNDSKRLTFVQENCLADGPDLWFGVRLIPPDPESLPHYFRQPGRYAPFHNQRVRLDDACLAVIQLPDYIDGDLILAQRRLGRFGPEGLPLWEGLISLSQPGLRELIAQGRQSPQPPANPADFAVFLDREAGRNRLLYAKADCSQAEYETPVFLHIYPARPEDLPPAARAVNFENRDFSLDIYGGRPGGKCVAIVPLPDYPIGEIRTGQIGRWDRQIYPSANLERLPADYRALAGLAPAARDVFDLYWRDNRLIYLRESCAAADMAAGFFLHITPEDSADLPQERRDYGFVNRDFAFAWWGGSFDGKCLAAVPLPDYPVKSIHTGQFQPVQGPLWAVELAAAP